MLLNVEYKDNKKTLIYKNYNLSLLGFLKHVGLSGSGENINIFSSSMEGLGFLLHFHRYFEFRNDLSNTWWALTKPDINFYDPTRTGQFSNVIAKGLTDFLAKKLSNAKYTHTYESALLVRNISYSGERPDLFCDTGSEQFAIESKGTTRKSISDAQMDDYKKQAESGPIPVKFSIVSACYGLYNKNHINVKYYDPPSENYIYEKEYNQYLARYYYTKVLRFLERNSSRYQSNSIIQDFITYRINIGFEESLLFHISKQILSFINKETDSVNQDYRSDENSYFDVDGIGLEIR